MQAKILKYTEKYAYFVYLLLSNHSDADLISAQLYTTQNRFEFDQILLDLKFKN